MQSKLQMLVISLVIMSGSLLPVVTQAETSASVSLANMYLWRGQNLTPDGPAISGSLDYKMAGAYAGIWASNETAGEETDIYAGSGLSLSGLSVDLSYWKYLYPENISSSGDNSLAGNDASDVVLSMGFGPVSATAYIAVESGADSDVYFTLKGTLGKYSLLYGQWSLENPGELLSNPGGGDEYGHIQFGFAATDSLSFAISKAISSDKNLANAVEEDPLFMVSYGLKFDLDKK
jgi:uncharacterized protein (TIGR02001 family)